MNPAKPSDIFPYEFSIVIPAFNEEKRILGTLRAIMAYIKKSGLRAEVIVVDDGSSDATAKVVREFLPPRDATLISYPENQGKGYAVARGVAASRGRYILFTDADGSTPIEEYASLKQTLAQGYEIAIGSRYLPSEKAKKKQPLLRIAIGRGGNVLIRLVLMSGITDTQCGFKLFEHRAAKEIFARQKIHRFLFDAEALVIAKRLGYCIAEVPVTWLDSSGSRLRPFRDSMRTLADLVLIKWNLVCGRYDRADNLS